MFIRFVTLARGDGVLRAGCGLCLKAAPLQGTVSCAPSEQRVAKARMLM